MISPVTTAVQLCNLALDLLGSKVTVSSLSDGSEEAAAYMRHAAMGVAAALGAANWPFARRFGVMFPAVGSSGTPVPAVDSWGYVYGVPSSNLVAPRSIYAGARAVNEASKIPFDFLTVLDPDDALETLQVIVTDEEGDSETTPVLEYTASVDPTFYPVPFTDLVVAEIALRLAAPLTASPERVAFVRQAREMAMQAAVASAMSQRREDMEPDGAFLSARG